MTAAQDIRKDKNNIFAAIMHEPGEEEGTSDFRFIYPESGDKEDVGQWMEILDNFQNILIESDYDEEQQFSVFESFIVMIVYSHDEDLEVSIDFTTFTKSLKAALIDEIPNQIRLLQEMII